MEQTKESNYFQTVFQNNFDDQMKEFEKYMEEIRIMPDGLIKTTMTLLIQMLSMEIGTAKMKLILPFKPTMERFVESFLNRIKISVQRNAVFLFSHYYNQHSDVNLTMIINMFSQLRSCFFDGGSYRIMIQTINYDTKTIIIFDDEEGCTSQPDLLFIVLNKLIDQAIMESLYYYLIEQENIERERKF